MEFNPNILVTCEIETCENFDIAIPFEWPADLEEINIWCGAGCNTQITKIEKIESK